VPSSIPCSELERFRREGFLRIGPLVDGERLLRMREEFEERVRREARQYGLPSEWYRLSVFQFRDLWREGGSFLERLKDRVVLDAVRTLLGVERVRLVFDYLISKPAGGAHVAFWHQDAPYLPIEPQRVVSCWMALDEVTRESGPLKFVVGSHLQGAAAPVRHGDAEPDFKGREVIEATLSAGEAVLFDGLLWHASEANCSKRDRRAYATVWMDAESRYRPERAPEHAINAHVRSAAGERFDDDWFPAFD